MDPVHFSGQEILEVAVRIEENGVLFYTEAAKRAATKKLKELFSFLATEEKKHITDFTNLKKLMTDEISALDPQFAESIPYLQDMANTHVFTKGKAGEMRGWDIENEKDVLAIAIDMEKDSIIFYYDLLGFIREANRPVLENLIQQEKGHLHKLRKIQDELER